MRLLRFAALVSVITAMVWGLFAFVVWALDPAAWSTSARALAAIWWAVFVGGAGAAAALSGDPK